MTAHEIARVVGGRVEGDPEVLVRGAQVDSRLLADDDLFVALPGERHDGHEFVGAALDVASAAMVRDNVELQPPPPRRSLVRVAEPLAAYHELARHERRLRGWQVAAVTGSVGKTTTKDYLAAMISGSRPTGFSTGNRNSTLGLPAEMLSQEPDVEVFIAETGMSKPGELTLLGEILRPQLVLYTRIAPAHVEFFPDLEGVVRAKAELLEWLDADGTLVINADDPNQRGFADEVSARVVRYGTPDADGRIEAVVDRGLLGSTFRLVLPDGEARVTLGLAGLHQAENLLAAATAASVFGVRADDVAELAAELRAPVHRGRQLSIGNNVTLVDDSYNSSPLAVRRMLELLAQVPGRRVAVLGEMYELGHLSVEAHRQVGCEAASSCDVLLAVGNADARTLIEAARDHGMTRTSTFLVESAERAAEVLETVLESGDVVLLKGSRGVGLDRTVAALGGDA
jgi:UDP-N-acetylmuramoyl-tripeptide--D-alanyl-D-alanine ligase